MEPGEVFKTMDKLSGLNETERKAIFNNSKPSIEMFINNLKKNKYTKILILAGAGISVSAGIPDFRSPNSGLFHNLQKYNLPQPESIFDLSFFRYNPDPFFTLTKEIYPTNFNPTPTHRFFQLLDEKNMLLRVYTQNIDTLERQTGMSGDKVIECHGSYATNTCLTCGQKYSQKWFKDKIFNLDSKNNNNNNNGKKPEEKATATMTVIPTCDRANCDGIVKPDITFYGENLPEIFGRMYKNDVQSADALIVLGTSLQVYPVAGIVDLVRPDIPRILINRDCVHRANYMGKVSKGTFEISTDGFWFGKKELDKHNYRDIFVQGDCDEVIKSICKDLNWDEELNTLLKKKDSKGNNSGHKNNSNNNGVEDDKKRGNGNDLSAMIDNLSIKE